MHHLIIGSGVAGLQAARAILEAEPQSRVSMLGRESAPPYSRPMISQLLEGTVNMNQLTLGLPSAVELITGDEALELDTEQKTVQTRSGRSLAFDRLLIASGADPRSIAAENADLDNIYYMRDKTQVESILENLSSCSRALVLGGGLVGFKAAYGLLRQGLPVTMLISSGYPLSQQVDQFTGALILEKLQNNGLQVQVGQEVQNFAAQNGRVSAAQLSEKNIGAIWA